MRIGLHHKLVMIGCTLALMLAHSGGAAHAQGTGQGRPYDEAQAQSIDRMLMCPVCVGVTIDQSQATIAQQMQGVVREMLAGGASRDEILAFFAARYGAKVLAAPPKSGVNLLAWVLPIVAVLAALTGSFFVVRSMASRAGGRIATEPLFDEGLEPYMETVDRELALSGGGPAASRPQHRAVGAAGASNRDGSGVEHPPEDGVKQDG